jgi:signal transduction histidine kinase
VRTLLARASGRIENDESRELVDQALSASDDVLARFGAMLRISEIESMNRRGGFADVDLAVLVERVYELYAPMAELKGVALTRRVLRTTRPNPVSGQLDSNVASETHVEADYPLMFEALSNLIDNAIKFTDAGGSVALEIEIRLSGTRIVVRDDGPGIAPDERHAVVQRFYRSEKTRDTPGSGLGLSIVFAVARLHDFRFTIVDAPRGATIHLDCWPQSIA